MSSTKTRARMAVETDGSPASAPKIRILEAAQALLQQGAIHASMAAIAKAAGISRQALYMHFGTREALLGALIDLPPAGERGVRDRWPQPRRLACNHSHMPCVWWEWRI